MIDVYVYNSNISSFSDISCTISSTSSEVEEITTSQSDYPTLTTLETKKNTTQFEFKIFPTAADSSIITLDFAFTDGETYNWEDQIELMVHAPIIEVLYIDYNDDGTVDQDNDHDHLYDINETIYLDLALINSGSGATSEMTGTLTFSDPSVSSVTGSYTFNAADGSSELHGFGQVTVVLSSSPAASDIEFELDLDDPPGRNHDDYSVYLHYDFIQPVQLSDLSFQQFGREGIELLCEPADDEDLDGYRVYRDPGPEEEEEFTALNNGNLLTGGSRYVDYLTESGESYDYKFNKVVDGQELWHSDDATAWLSHPLLEDFPVDFGFGAAAGVVVTNLADDEVGEIWVGTTLSEIIKIKSDGSITSWEIDNPGTVSSFTKPILANLDGDPRDEILFGANLSDGSTHLLLFDYVNDNIQPSLSHDIQLTEANDGHQFNSPPSICDVDDDGHIEIASTTYSVGLDQTLIHLYEYIREEDPAPRRDDYEWRMRENIWPDEYNNSCYNICTPATGKPDGEETWLYYAIGNSENRIRGKSHDLQDWWEFPGDEEDELSGRVGSVSLGDVDHDQNNSLDVVFITADLVLHVIDALTGNPLDGWENEEEETVGIKLPASIGIFDKWQMKPALANIDEDEALEIVIASPDSVYIFHHDGTIVENWPQVRNNLIIENWCGSPLVADVNGDEVMDIIMPNGHHQIEAWDSETGELLEYWPIIVGDRISDVVIKDIDNNSDIELVVTTGGGFVYIYDLGEDTGEVQWGQRYHDDWHTSNYHFEPPDPPGGAEPRHLFGVLSDNENPYVLDWNCVIPDGEALIPDPGVIFEFASGTELLVEDGASLCVEGVENDSIYFIANASDWVGIKFESSTSENTSILGYCRISQASTGLYIAGLLSTTSHLTIEDCRIDNCGYGIYANNSYLNVTDCHITESNGGTSAAGIYLINCMLSYVTIDNTRINNNGETLGTE
ncbi:MAG: right-handed parallel beta-helix repeat-containing protein, partial [Candidatus Hatepunaea meridiana]|nr:right-handed parallel beta-helix repeat-containing protein [Candidatus Hatepunaea meridiana]